MRRRRGTALHPYPCNSRTLASPQSPALCVFFRCLHWNLQNTNVQWTLAFSHVPAGELDVASPSLTPLTASNSPAGTCESANVHWTLAFWRFQCKYRKNTKSMCKALEIEVMGRGGSHSSLRVRPPDNCALSRQSLFFFRACLDRACFFSRMSRQSLFFFAHV